MKFAEIGMPRTGTRSLAHAMQILGYKVRHGISGDDPLFSKTVEEVLRGEFNLSIYEGFDYVGNFPHLHWQDLVGSVPKLILTVRNVREWADSCERNWSKKRKQSCERISIQCTPPQELLRILLSMSVNGSYEFNRDLWMLSFVYHNQRVIQRFKFTDRLLVMNVFEGDGWEKLCAFTGDPIPDVPFPNTTEKIR